MKKTGQRKKAQIFLVNTVAEYHKKMGTAEYNAPSSQVCIKKVLNCLLNSGLRML